MSFQSVVEVHRCSLYLEWISFVHLSIASNEEEAEAGNRDSSRSSYKSLLVLQVHGSAMQRYWLPIHLASDFGDVLGVVCPFEAVRSYLLDWRISVQACGMVDGGPYCRPTMYAEL